MRRKWCRACLAAGPALIAVALGFVIYTSWFLHRSVAAKGAVVSLREVHDPQNGTVTYAPVFTFTAADGRSYAVSSNTGNNPPAFAVGQQVPVLYETDNPTEAKIDSFIQLWLFPVVFGFAGATATAVGYFLLRYERRRNPQFRFLPSWAPKPNEPDLRGHLLGGPKVNDFTVERDRDTGRDLSL
jgi:hypothetical protein